MVKQGGRRGTKRLIIVETLFSNEMILNFYPTSTTINRPTTKCAAAAGRWPHVGLLLGYWRAIQKRRFKIKLTGQKSKVKS
jgi:hypothetical protein